MFSSLRRLRPAPALLLLVSLLLVSCSRAKPPAIERLAILRFENLTPGVSDWMGRAFAEVMSAELAAAPGIYAIPTTRLHSLNQNMGARPIAAPGISSERQLAMAAGANRMGYGEFSIAGGKIRARLTVEDPELHRVALGPVEVSFPDGDMIAAATALARALSPQAESYGTRSQAALQAYTLAMESPDQAAVAHYAEDAVAADPDFAMARLILAELKVRQKDAAGAKATVDAALARSSLRPADRARLEILGAGLRGDAAATERATSDLARLSPLDASAWRAVADLAFTRKQFPQAIQAYQQVLRIEPEDVNAWNQLGYTAAYGGNLEVAMTALRRYQALRPDDPNALDSMGDVNLLLGRLAEAERFYLESYKKAPAFLNGLDAQKAALAHLMTGDVAGADAIVKIPTPEWLWATGRKQEAYDKLAAEAASTTSRDRQAAAYAELAIWSLLLGDRAAAAQMGTRAAGVATPATVATVAVARFISLPSAPAAEWADRARTGFPNPAASSLRDLALTYALLLDGRFPEAAAVLQQLEARNPPAAERAVDILLGWALVETGDLQGAAARLRLNPVPGPTGLGPFFGVEFPRLFQLRARVAEKAGKPDEARENARIYAALGGR